MDVSKNTIAIVDDDEDVLLSARLFLKKYFEEIRTYLHPSELLKELSQLKVSTILLDMNYTSGNNDGEEGLAILKEIKQLNPEIEIVVMTAYAEVKLAVEAVRLGAFDFVVKPWQNEKLLVTIVNAVQKRSMKERLQQQEILIQTPMEHLTPLVGESDALQQIRAVIHQLAPTQVNIHLQGESGCGKELVAKHIHNLSKQAQQAFILMDFSLVNESQQYETLFGSDTLPLGKWKQAIGGTLYLKEITAMHSLVQEQLFMLLQGERENNVRLITSSIENPLENNFHKKLFYSLSTIEIDIPPLRKRQEDLAELIDHYVDFYLEHYSKDIPSIDNSIADELSDYKWPGNVLELKRAIERAVLIKQDKIEAYDLIPISAPSHLKTSQKLADIEREHIISILKQWKGNIQQSAAQLGISRAALYRRMEKYNLSV